LEATPIFSDLNISDRIRNILLQQGWTYIFSHLFASVRLDKAAEASQWIHHFNVCHFGRFNSHGWSETPMFSNLSATHVVGVAQSTSQALANMDSHSPKHVEPWSQPSQVWMEDGKYESNH